MNTISKLEILIRGVAKFIYYRLRFLPLSPQAAFVKDSKIDHIGSSRCSEILDEINNKKNVYFIQIGSNDGISNDPLYHRIKDNSHWSGVLVEPVPYLFRKLLDNYENKNNLIFENSLISVSNGIKKFYYVKYNQISEGNELPKYSSQLGSLNKDHILKHFNIDIEHHIEYDYLPCITFHSLLEKHSIYSVDLIHIDAEGHDYKIFKQINIEKLKPYLLIIEYKHLSYFEALFLVSSLNSKYKLFINGADLYAVRQQ